MIKYEIQVLALIAFVIILALSLYKLYAIFSTPLEGPDTKLQHLQLEKIIIDFLKHAERTDLNSKELFDLLVQTDTLKDDSFKNFNHNRLNQLLHQLFYTFDVNSLSELIAKVQNNA